MNHGVDTIFAYPGGASIPLHQALTRFRDKIRVILPRHEQGRRVCRAGLRPLDRQARRVHGHQRARGHEPRDRHRRRQARQHSADRHHRPGRHAGDRHRRLSGNADRRSLPRRHQAPLSGDRRERHRPGHARGVPHRHDRPAGPGAGRYAEERAESQIVPDYDAPMQSARLSGRGPQRHGRGDRRGGGADPHAPSGR